MEQLIVAFFGDPTAQNSQDAQQQLYQFQQSPEAWQAALNLVKNEDQNVIIFTAIVLYGVKKY